MPIIKGFEAISSILCTLTCSLALSPSAMDDTDQGFWQLTASWFWTSHLPEL
jgi:hypothetical protein